MKYSKFILLISTFFFAFTMNSCKKKIDYTPTPPKEKLVITIQDQFQTPPSRVSIFFKVETTKGNPVSGLTEDNFSIYEKGRNDDVERLLSVDEASRIISDNGEVFKYYTILLLDLSGSVLQGNLPNLKEAAGNFVDDVMADQSNAENHLGIWWFDGEDALHPLIDFTKDTDNIHAAIDGINSDISDDTSTDLFGAILKSTTLAKSKLAEADLEDILSAVSIIVFTDGTDQAARYSREEAYAAVENADENIHYYTIGLGNEIDETVLNKIGKSSSVFADDTEALSTKFEEIAGLIYSEANSFYFFEYCTPKRDGSGISDLHIYIKQDDLEGDKKTTFDGTGFYDDCDLF